MARTIKMGNFIVEVPDNSSLLAPGRSVSPLETKAERPDVPSEPEPEVYVYQPNDPYRSAIDRVHAIGSLERVDKPWVQRTFFLFFVIVPFVVGELAAVAVALHEEGFMKVKLFLLVNFFVLLLCAPYFIIWRRARKAKARVRGSVA